MSKEQSNNLDNLKLPPKITRFVFVKNLPNKISPEELYDIFWRFGPVRQIRKGIIKRNKSTAFVVYENILDAKKCVDVLSGVNVVGKYLVCLYFHPEKRKLAYK